MAEGRAALSAPPSVDVLVVDDSPQELAAIQVALSGIATNLVATRSGTEALRAVDQRDYALIILDVCMPGMSGFEAARLMRTRVVPMIFITARDCPLDDVLKAYRLGAADFLFKPVATEILRAKAAVFVELRQSALVIQQQAEQLRELSKIEHQRELVEQRRLLEAAALRGRLDEQQRYAAELARKNEELERAHLALEHTNARLAEADRSKAERLAIVAHELRNPLSPLLLGVELLSERDGDESVHGAVLPAMRRQVLHLVRLVEDLLDAARIDSNRITIEREDLLLREIIEEAVAISRPLVDARHHTLRVDLQAGEAELNGDRVRLIQVISNLLNNAARYTDAGGLIQITCEADEEGVRVTVTDSGCGMTPELIEVAFEMFRQGRPGGGGLGVGLALVKRVVELHGGRVGVTSPGPGRGSAFDVWVPRVAGPGSVASYAG